MAASDEPRPCGAVHVIVPDPALAFPMACLQLNGAFDRKVNDTFALLAYPPEHRPTWAASRNVCGLLIESSRPGLTRKLPLLPRQPVVTTCAVVTIGPVLVGGLSPRALIA